jgi:HSP20 family protein
MALMRRGEFTNPYPSLWNKLFDDEFFNMNFSSTGTTLPSVNIRETKDDFVVEVAAPGMRKEDFRIELDNNIMSISSERSETDEDKDNEGNYTRREFSYQSFQRSFTLPSSVHGENISAQYKDGVLNIVIPKKEEAKQKPSRIIEIQ